MIKDNEPLFGKKGQPLDRETLKGIASRLLGSHGHSERKAKQGLRWALLNDDVKPAAWVRLQEQYDSDVVRKGVRPHLSAALNPADDTVRALCKVYGRQTQRRILRSKAKAEALQTLYTEAGIQNLGPDWNRIGYFCGPLFVLPQVRGEQMTVDTIPPHKRELVLDEENPCGPPVALAYVAPRERIVVVTLDAITTYRVVGGEPQAEKREDCSALKAKARPWGSLRFDAPLTADDYDRCSAHDRLTDATIDVTAISAVLGYIRKAQNKVLLFLSGRLEKMPKGQNLGEPQKPVVIETDNDAQARLQSVNFDTPVKHFIEHIRFLTSAAAESTGVPATVSQDGVDLEFAFDGLSEFRDEQIQYADTFEMELAIAMVLAAEDGKHPLWVAGKLPTVDEVRKGFRVNFGRLGRRYANPQEQRDQIDWEIRHGMLSFVDYVAAQFPLIPRDEVEKQIREILEENAELWDFMASRNVGATDDGKAITGAQANGAKGPAERDKDKVTDDVDQSAS